MPINLNIDGVSKNVISPEVNIDGVWRQVNIVSNNINGVWRESFNRNVYKVKLYRYGVLYDTLSVAKGSSVTLPTVPTVYDDDVAHYGWTKTAGATSRDYSATAKITPTADMDLYAVYSYYVTEKITATSTYISGSTIPIITIPYSGTFTINRAYYGTSATGNIAIGETTNVRVSIDGTYLSLTASQIPYSTSVTQGTVIQIGIAAGQSVSTPGGSVSISGICTVTYPSYKTITLYRSSYGDCTIILYQDDKLISTETVSQGSSYTFPEKCTNEKNNVLSGWGQSSSSTSILYRPAETVRVTSDLTLYAKYYSYSYLDTDGDGYFIFTGCHAITTESYSMNGGHSVGTGYHSYNITFTFTDGSTKTITLGNTEGDTTVRFDSMVGISELNVPQGFTSSESGDTYRVTVTHSYKCTAQRYLY